MQLIRILHKTTHHHHSTSAMAIPSLSLSSSINPNPNFLNFTFKTSFDLPRTFKTSPIHSNLNKSQLHTPPQQPPQQPPQPPLQDGVNNADGANLNKSPSETYSEQLPLRPPQTPLDGANLDKSSSEQASQRPPQSPLQDGVNNADGANFNKSHSETYSEQSLPQPPQSPLHDGVNNADGVNFNDSPSGNYSEQPPQRLPPPPQQGGVDTADVLLSTASSKRSFAVATGELFSGIASRLINLQKKKNVSSFEDSEVLSENFDNGERIEGVVQPPLQDDVNNAAEKRSFAVATGLLFSGIASRLINFQKKNVSSFEDSAELRERGDGGERIAKVIEDFSQPEGVVWEQREEDVEEEKRMKAVSSPGFSFSAAGLLFPYHLGVARFLIENGYIKETTPLAGSSAGAIICAVIASGSSMQDALQATKVLAEDCRLRGTAFRLGAVLRDVLEKVLPEDAHIRCNGRVRVAVTQIGWRPRGLLIDHFDSREDLINALFTSSFIPGYLAPRPVTMFRNRICIDGGLTLFMPPTSASQTVRVCAFPASTLRMQGIGISPDCNPQNRLSTRQLLNYALEPANDVLLDKFYEFGYLDAAVWAQENPVDLILQEEKTQG